MRTKRMPMQLCVLACGTLWALLPGGLWAAPAEEFRLTEYLGHAWQREAVAFPLTKAQRREAKAGRALCGPDGKAIPYQLIGDTAARDTKVVFQTDLAPYETRAFQFTDARGVTDSDLTVAETPEVITLANSRTGIRIVRKLAAGAGAIAGVRLPSGTWVAGSRLTTDQPVTQYTATVIARGPIFTEVVCRATIGKNATWEMRLRLYAYEPVVLVDETSAIDGPAVTFRLDLQGNFNPDTLLFRSGRSDPGIPYGKNLTWKLAAGEAYWLQPWLRWQQRQRQGNYRNAWTECPAACRGDEGHPKPGGYKGEVGSPLSTLALAKMADKLSTWDYGERVIRSMT